jgi:surface polysaccharide O-acyltransferase-like enzyme
MTQGKAKTARNSSIELLRIICIMGIIFMHTFAYGGTKIADYNRYIQIAVNCFTNLGVSSFMLISGYFGIKRDIKKLICFDVMAIFYSFVQLAIRISLNDKPGGMDVLSSVFPVLSKTYWYLTVYVIIVVLAPYINEIPERLSKQNFTRLLVILIFFSSVVSTCLSFDIIGNEGKNLIHMTLVYLIGRYMAKYDHREYRAGRLVLVFAISVLVTMALEFALFTVTGRYSLFYRDCSIFTLFSSVVVFMIFKNMKFTSGLINRISRAALGVYVFSYGFQRLIYVLIPLKKHAFKTDFFPLVCIFAVIVIAGCTVGELIRQTLFGRLEMRFALWAEEKFKTVYSWCEDKTSLFVGKILKLLEKSAQEEK